MGAIDHFADWFKARKTPITQWYSDGVGRWAFRVTVDGQSFVCAARKSAPSAGMTSLMRRVAGRAQANDALIALMLPDDRIYVFDPVAVLAAGTDDDVALSERAERAEDWVRIPLSIGCRFGDWHDGADAPSTFSDVRA